LSLVQSVTRTGARLAGVPVRGAAVMLEQTGAMQRRATAGFVEAGEQVARDMLDAAVAWLLAGDLVDRVIVHLEQTGAAQRVAERVLDDGIAEQIAIRVAAGPELERILSTALAGALPDVVVSRLLESEALWVLVDEIARSPSVTEAIAHQGSGFAEQVAGVVRERSREADGWVEHVAHGLRRRYRSRADAQLLEASKPRPLPDGGAR
jgi:hypothetical protein